MKTKLMSWLVVTTILTCSPVLSQERFPVYVFPQLLRPNDPVVSSMGLTGTAYRTGVLAPLSNPAGLSGVNGFEISYSHVPFHHVFSDDLDRQNGFSAGVAFPDGFVMGFSYSSFAQDETGLVDRITPLIPDVLSEPSADIRQIQISVAKKIGRWRLGVNGKHVDNDLGIVRGTGWLMDLGLMRDWTIFATDSASTLFSTGLTVANLGSSLKYRFRKGSELGGGAIPEEDYFESAPRFLRIGLAVINSSGGGSRSGFSGFVASAEYQGSLNRDTYRWDRLAAGVELNSMEHFSLRIGYNFDLRKKSSYEDFEGLTFGFGVDSGVVNLEKMPIRMEFSFGKSVDLGSAVNSYVVAGLFAYGF